MAASSGRRRQPERRVEERARGDRRGPEDRPRAGDAQGSGNGHVARMVDRRVEEHDPRDRCRMIDRPAEGDHPAPIVTEGDHGCVEGERFGERSQVGDALSERPMRPGAIGVAHVELIDGDHAPRRLARLGGADGLGHEVTPEIRPRRVAVHREDRADHGGAEPCELVAGVEAMPAARPPRVDTPTRRGDDATEPWIESGKAWRGKRGARSHQASSIMAVFRPEPTPMSSTRSPFLRVACSSTRVIGIDAGPTLP